MNTRDGFFQLVDDEGRKFYLSHVTLRTSMTNGEKNAYLFQLNQMADDLSNAYVLNISPMDVNNSNVKRLEDGVYAWSADPEEDYVRIWRIGETDMYFWEDSITAKWMKSNSNRVNPPDVKIEKQHNSLSGTDNLTVKQGNVIPIEVNFINPTAVDATETPDIFSIGIVAEDKPRGATRVKET
ncbi:hypothetical protein SPFM12_00106 [Salmonella phage SPFM12]|nr:hypothetical protein SPFM12_00106 [Salmonella phage SPFM12]